MHNRYKSVDRKEYKSQENLDDMINNSL